MGLGAWFHGSVDDVIGWFETLGSTALMVVGACWRCSCCSST
jgi:hypothetical protein